MSSPSSPDRPDSDGEPTIEPTLSFEEPAPESDAPTTEASPTEPATSEASVTEPATSETESTWTETTWAETPVAATAETPTVVPPTTEYAATAARFSQPAMVSLGEPETASLGDPETARFGEPETARFDQPEGPIDAGPPAPGPDLSSNVTVRRGIRMRTVVFGLVLMAVAVSVLIGQLTDITVDVGVVALALMIGCGVLLIAGARRSSTGQ